LARSDSAFDACLRPNYGAKKKIFLIVVREALFEFISAYIQADSEETTQVPHTGSKLGDDRKKRVRK
jgi:hypothetical protein